jgi:uncharacterized phage protein (TIGR01671 family)
MTRAIRFRGKNYGGIWLYGYLMPAEKPVIYKDCKYRISVSPQSCTGKDKMVYEIISDTIGQDTGLKDKNGNEIYEGDIVKTKEIGGYGMEHIGVVKYYNKDCRFGIDTTTTNKFSERILFTDGECSFNDGYCTITYTNEYEVIGNIHDNPELLQTETL